MTRRNRTPIPFVSSKRGRLVEQAMALTLLFALGVACHPRGSATADNASGDSGELASAGEDASAGGERAGQGTDPADWPRMNPAARSAYEAGMRAFLAGDLESAARHLEGAERADPRAFRAVYSFGVVQQRLGKDGVALKAFQRAFGIVGQYEPAIVAYALLLARGGDLVGSERFLNDQLGKMPKSAAISAALAEIMSLRGDSGAAQRYAQEALKKNPDYRPAMVTLARDHYRNRRLDLALYALKGILEGYGPENPPRDKDNADALLLRGLIYEEQGERGAAMTDFRQAITLRPDLVEARLHLARYLLEAGNANEAVPLLEAAAKYDRSNLFVRLNLGDGYRLQGKAGAAREQLEWVTKTDPQLAQPYYNLGLLFLFAQQIPGVTALDAANKAIESLETYKALAGRSEGPGDVDELITRAKAQKALIQASSPASGRPGDALDAMDAQPAGGAK